MTWRWVAASVAGTSHSDAGQPCQDAYRVRMLSSHAGESVLGIFVADGAGSARYGGEGAEAAVQAASDFWADHLIAPDSLIDVASMDLCVAAIRARLASLASEFGEPVRECACTFISVLASPREAVTYQVGDGGVVLDCGEGYRLATRPMVGEYANTTCFITDSDDSDAKGEAIWHGAPARRLCVFTDGLQRFALGHDLSEANPLFLDRRFATLETVSPDQEDQLQPALAAFLACEAINRHTDDDKTLVLASLMPE